MRRASLLWWAGVLVVAGSSGCSCGPALPFTPSNLPADAPLNASEDIVFNGELCGPRAEINTDTGDIDCFSPGVFNPRFNYTSLRNARQADGTEVALIVGRNVRVDLNNEVQIRGSRPLVLVALDTMRIMGRITAQNSITKYEGEGGGASEPGTAQTAGLGAGGGGVGGTNAGAGGASYCGRGGSGGNDTNPAETGGAGGATYGTPELVPLRGGSSGGKHGNSHSGAGGGAVQLVAGNLLEIASGAVINMGGLGGGWYGSGGGSGGAILLEAPAVTVAGTLAANGGGGGGGSSAGGQGGANATADANAAPGGAGGAGGGTGGAGSAGTNLDGSPGQNSDGQPGGGGGGAGRIRINSSSGAATLTGATLSPPVGTSCTTQGTVAPAR